MNYILYSIICVMIGLLVGANLKELDAKWWRLKYRVNCWWKKFINTKERE